MRHEKSCGAVVYRIHHQQIEYLVIRMQLGHYSLPKGHVEAHETELQTARREIKEETHLDVTIHRGFHHVVTYSPQIDIIKEVVFFLARYRHGELRLQLEEVAEANWLLYEHAMSQLTYDTDRQMIRLANQFLHQRTSF